jgi:ABC-type Na+ transport system ATPase subunit NatA
LIGDGYISIAKSLDHDPYYTALKDAAPAVDINASNRLQAVCSSEEGQRAVHLVFSVNGRVVAEATDSENPLSTGTVGVFVATGPDAKTAVEAEFDDFAVRQI